MRLLLLSLLFPLCFQAKIIAQQGPLKAPVQRVSVNAAPQKNLSVLDSVVLATQQREKFVADSVAVQYIKYPDSAIIRQNITARLKSQLYAGYNFLDIPSKSKSILREGTSRKTRDQWIIVIVLALLTYAAILNLTVNKDIKIVLQSFYSKRAVALAGKDEVYINFLSFLAFLLFFGFTFGLFLYQLAAYEDRYYRYNGLQLFVFLSLIIISLFALKFIVLKFIGFIFDIDKLVSEYVSVLYLTYFNIAFAFLPVGICFSLLDGLYISYVLYLALALILIIFMWLYLRSSVNIISSFRFHKFYLIIYLCALEICPVLILIKALNI